METLSPMTVKPEENVETKKWRKKKKKKERKKEREVDITIKFLCLSR